MQKYFGNSAKKLILILSPKSKVSSNTIQVVPEHLMPAIKAREMLDALEKFATEEDRLLRTEELSDLLNTILER